jgi:ATP-binding cassette subfamily F protein 3
VQTQLLLEVWLQEYRGSFVIVSHDREFLKSVCTSTVEIERGKATSFPQGIEVYLAWKEEQVQVKERFNKSIEMQQKQLQTFIDRFRAKASKATQAQSKIKQLERLQTIEIEQPLKTVRIQIPQVEHRNTFALRTCRLAIGYGEAVIARDIDIEILRGERVAIVGENGKGKSTFLKTAAEVIKPLEGTCTWNNRLKIGYYAQQVHEALDPRDTIDQYLGRYMGVLVTREDVLRIAGNFLFTQDDLTKPISVLSGGEKARLCLAGLLLSRPDVLLLDEPTNHLDMETVEALGESLSRWRGTIIFVSHSRTFVHLLATALLDVREGTIKRDIRTYDEYIADLRDEESRRVVSSGVALETDNEREKRLKQERYERVQELKREVRKIEKQLEDFSLKKERMLKVFADKPMETTPEQAREFNTIETVLAHAEAEWLRVQTELSVLGH